MGKRFYNIKKRIISLALPLILMLGMVSCDDGLSEDELDPDYFRYEGKWGKAQKDSFVIFTEI